LRTARRYHLYAPLQDIRALDQHAPLRIVLLERCEVCACRDGCGDVFG
jgi:hypothetical protein